MKKVVMIASVVIAIGLTGLVALAVNGKIAPLSWGLWGDINLESGVAVRGYDVVSYHSSGTSDRRRLIYLGVYKFYYDEDRVDHDPIFSFSLFN